MQMIPVLLAALALMLGLVCTVVARKIWQRVLALCVVAIIVLFITHTATIIGRKRIIAWHYARNIQPTGQLWAMVQDSVQAEDYPKVDAALDLICTNWPSIGAWPKSYSAQDILDEIEQEDSEPNIGQVSSEGAPSDEPSM